MRVRFRRLRAVSAVGSIMGMVVAVVAGAALAAPGAGARPDGQGALYQRQAAQARLAALADRLGSRLGERAAGAYFDSHGALVVNVLDSQAARTVRDSGAQARLVTRSSVTLNAIITRFDAVPQVADTAWGVDPRGNQVVLAIGESVTAQQRSGLLRVANRHGDAVRVENAAGSFDPLLRGGDAIYTSRWRCSAGFNVTESKVLTAGHCAESNPDWHVSPGGPRIGPTIGSSYPGNDYGIFRNDAGISQPGEVNVYGGSRDITNAGNAKVGQSVCKSGSTTKVTCGRVTALNVTVNYGGGDIVHGLIQSDVCADRGDSGGAMFGGDTAMGLTSGGNLVCGSGQTRTFFQPVTEALQAYHVDVY